MRYIDLQTWSRRDHFNFFSTYDYPHFSMCANMDLTAFRPALKHRGISFTVGMVYVIGRAANAVPEFRQRMRDGGVVEHDIVHPATTILSGEAEDLFVFCAFEYDEDFLTFAASATEQIARARECPTLEAELERDDLLYMTSIPWVSFTSFVHPLDRNVGISVPRFAWGKFFQEGQLLKLPFNVQAHHALVDGIHMGRYFAEVQDLLHHPDF